MATTLHGPPTTAKPPADPQRKRPFVVQFYGTSVGKKFVMAVTGLIGIGFVLGHMVGNLKIYLGAEEINTYAEFLRDFGYPLLPHTVLLWIIRLVLLGALVLHVHAAYALTQANKQAVGGKRYRSEREWVVASFASRTTRWTGVIILLYILFHLADLTWGLPGFSEDWVRGEVYDNFVNSMGRWWAALIYVVANVALAIHLFHGTWSLFQTMGWNNKRFNHLRRYVAAGVAGLVLVGNLSFPILVQLDAVRPEGLFGL